MSKTEADKLRELTPTAEEAVIGSMLIDSGCVGDVLMHIREDDFQAPRLRALFCAIRDLYLSRLPVDPVTVIDRAGVELADTVRTCMDLTPTAANVLHYCAAARDQATLNRLHGIADELAQTKSVDGARDVLARADAVMSDKPGVRSSSIAEMMVSFLRRLSSPAPHYVKWGLGMLDKALHTGPGSYVLIGARPSTGKTALALQLALNVAQDRRVGFFSLETSPEVAADRIAAATLSVTLPDIKNRRVSDSTVHALTFQASREDAFRRSFEFISAPSMSVAEIRAVALAKRLDVIFIDYVQLIRPTGRGDRTELMQSVSMELRAMAQLTGVVVVALAQLRRPDTQTKAKAPTMADLKESGQFEQDADTILLMYLQDAENRRSDRMIKVEKNKEGYAGLAARFAFDGEKQRFTYVDKDGRPWKPAEFHEIDDDGQEALPGEWT